MNDSKPTLLTEESLRALLATELANFLDLPQGSVDPAKSFDEYGLDSTDAIVMVGVLEEQIGAELEPELLLQNRCLDDVVASLKTRGMLA